VDTDAYQHIKHYLVGGCALNKTAVSKLSAVWDDIWVPTNPGDPGSCIGAVCAKYQKHIDFHGEMWYNKDNGETNKDYGYEIQKLYLEMMLCDAETFVRCQSIFDYTLFDRKLQETADFVNKYVAEYNSLPTYDIVNKSCNIELKPAESLTEEHFNWLLDDFETFIRHKSLERAILKSADMLENGEYGPVEELVKKAVQIGLHKDIGTDYFDDPKARLMGLKDQNGQVSTGWTTLDRKLFGGFNKGELNIFAGGSGAGKSLFLANLGCNWVLNGLNVAYITLN